MSGQWLSYTNRKDLNRLVPRPAVQHCNRDSGVVCRSNSMLGMNTRDRGKDGHRNAGTPLCR